ncbi:hypothetical protein OIO90_004877 [Microbotryomycetes sp. JL221]|nr:hypothetical protein OIO90_004877 [Microbotryomycetes sp. JL221]
MTAERTPKSQPLQKGLACSTCKARKVKCDAVHPVCGACVRSSRFEGREPVDCVYKGLQGRRKRKNGRSRSTTKASDSESHHGSCCSSSAHSSDDNDSTASSPHPAHALDRVPSSAEATSMTSTTPPSAEALPQPTSRSAATTHSLVLPLLPSANVYNTWPALDLPQQWTSFSTPNTFAATSLPPAPPVSELPQPQQQQLQLQLQQQGSASTPELDTAAWSDLSGSPTESLFEEPLFSTPSFTSSAPTFSWFDPATLNVTQTQANTLFDPTLSLPMMPFAAYNYNAKDDSTFTWPTTPAAFDAMSNLPFSPFSMA